MKTLNATLVAAGVLGLALSTSTFAQQSQTNFPDESKSEVTCEAVDWNRNMRSNHPRLIDACQEVIVVDGESWARFDARFKELKSDGHVVFNVLDRRERTVEEVSFMPTTGQVAYINDRSTPFRQLRTTDAISLYVPEGQYGFATQPGAPREQVAAVVPPRPSSSTPVVADRTTEQPATRTTAARTDTRPAVLPATASSLSWIAIAGFLAMLSGMILTMRRWF